MHKNTIIFDFDGTIADVEPLFIDIYNTLAEEFRFDPIAADEIPSLKALSARDFIRTKLKISFWRIPWILRRGQQAYHQRSDQVAVFEGLPAIIDELRQRGYRIGILSSSRRATIQAILDRTGITVDFIYESSLFGKARAMRKALRMEKITTDRVAYIGDEVRDVEACRQCDLEVIAVTWGLNNREALQAAGAPTIDQPTELLDRFPSCL